MSNIVYEVRDRIAYITIDRPEAMNALGPQDNEDIIKAWTEFDSDPDAWVAILTGSGDKAFCAGADLKTYTPMLAERDIYDLRQDSNRPGFGGITRGLDIWKPIIAAVNGYALAGGLELALACDIRLASSNAQFGSFEVKRGFHHSDGGTARLPLIVGLGNALRMLLTGEAIDAPEALRIGLVSEVVTSEELIVSAERYASLIMHTVLWELGRPKNPCCAAWEGLWRMPCATKTSSSRPSLGPKISKRDPGHSLRSGNRTGRPSNRSLLIKAHFDQDASIRRRHQDILALDPDRIHRKVIDCRRCDGGARFEVECATVHGTHHLVVVDLPPGEQCLGVRAGLLHRIVVALQVHQEYPVLSDED